MLIISVQNLEENREMLLALEHALIFQADVNSA